MPKTHIDKSIIVKKTPSEVYAIVRDFNQWQPWSPWLICEPGVKVNVSEDGNFYEWEGDLVGSGNMTIESEKENEEIQMTLMFLKPWKSKASVAFYMKSEGEGTRLTWTMDGSLPWFMFWMKKMMESFIGMDYDRGLNLLKDYIEDGKVHSELEFNGVSEFPGCQYVGIKTDCRISDMPEHMEKNYTKLMTYFMDGREEYMAGAPFSIYHKWKLVKDQSSFTSAVPVAKVPEDLPEGVFVSSVPATKVHKVTHSGPYRHNGNVWSAQVVRQRAKKFKTNRKVDPMEVYLNSPKNTPELELKTEVLFPVI